MNRFNQHILPTIRKGAWGIYRKYQLLFISVFIGLISGACAVIIKNSSHLVQSFFTGIFVELNWLVIVLPLIGLLLLHVFMKYVLKKQIAGGVPNVLHAISKTRGNIGVYNAYASWAGSVLTVGFGGSAGLESPVISTNTSLSSFISKKFGMSYSQKMLLIGCASAASLASVFNAPVAALVFAIEVMMLDLSMGSLIPLLLASISATVTSQFFLGDSVLLNVEVTDIHPFRNLHVFIVLGITSALGSILFTRQYFYLKDLWDKLSFSTWHKVIAGALGLGIMLFFFPALYGEGYATINQMIDNSLVHVDFPYFMSGWLEHRGWILLVLFLLIALKMTATSLTLSMQGVGGIFAPALFMGACLGNLTAKVLNYTEIMSVPETECTLIGIAGFMAATLHAPLTSIFLIAEITGGYKIFIPLMATTAMSYITRQLFYKHSIYAHQFAERGELISHDRDQAALSLLHLSDLMERNFAVINIGGSFSDLIAAIRRSKRNVFPVVDDDYVLKGVIHLDNVRDKMFDPQSEDLLIKDLVEKIPFIAKADASLKELIDAFEEYGVWSIPIVDVSGKYLGFVSKSSILSAYRQELKNFYME